ncbi:MAG: hypothetical protein LBH25_05140 [Fibromonadaceae bacterium]|jgi:hypothetical protein|nr:hypothetical protein [Fibromonadaceae bacterium]
METMLAVPKIKMAIKNIGLEERANDLLDEIKLNLMLKESEEDEKAGRFITLDELRKIMSHFPEHLNMS